MAPIRDWTGAITFFPTSPHKKQTQIPPPLVCDGDNWLAVRVLQLL